MNEKLSAVSSNVIQGLFSEVWWLGFKGVFVSPSRPRQKALFVLLETF